MTYWLRDIVLLLFLAAWPFALVTFAARDAMIGISVYAAGAVILGLLALARRSRAPWPTAKS